MPTSAPTITLSQIPPITPTYTTSAPSQCTCTCKQSIQPTTSPTEISSFTPTSVLTSIPTLIPTSLPTSAPTFVPSSFKVTAVTPAPTSVPTLVPTHVPSTVPTSVPTHVPSTDPTSVPTHVPSTVPTTVPSSLKVTAVTAAPSSVRSSVPTSFPTATPSTLKVFFVTAAPTIAPTKCIESVFTYAGIPASINQALIPCEFSPNCYTLTSTGGSHPASIQTCGYTTSSTALLTLGTPNPIVYVNNAPTVTYGDKDQGLGLCNYIPAGSLPYTNQQQSPYKITNYDNNHINPIYLNEINFIQIDTSTAPTLQYNITGNQFGNEYFAVFCSPIKGVLGTLNQYSSSFGTWLSLTLPSTGCRYVGFTPYTHKVGSSNNPSIYCAHTAILVNIRVPCTTTTYSSSHDKRKMLRG